MGAFEYTALDVRGRRRKGVMEGDTARQVRQLLREQGLSPLAVEQAAQSERRERGAVGGIHLRRGISAPELAILTRQLATLVRAGLPLEECLQTVGRQVERSRLKSMLLAVRAKVMEGHTLATGMGEFPHVFPDLYRATVEAGEQSGHLEAVLERLADYTERRQQLRQKVQLALFYPAILTVVGLGVVVALLTYVVPQVVQVFENMSQELPALTIALIGLSDFLREYGLLLLMLLSVALVILLRMLRVPALRERYHRLLHRLPLIGRLKQGANTARFARTFSILTASGVPVLQAMRISAEVLGSLPMRRAVDEATARVREGSGIARALERGGYFPPMTLNLIASGESSGRLEEMLERAADNQESELETTISTVMGLFEPLMILLMGAIVLLVVMAILMPIFELNQMVR